MKLEKDRTLEKDSSYFSVMDLNCASLMLINLKFIKLENFVFSVELFGTKTEE